MSNLDELEIVENQIADLQNELKDCTIKIIKIRNKISETRDRYRKMVIAKYGIKFLYTIQHNYIDKKQNKIFRISQDGLFITKEKAEDVLNDKQIDNIEYSIDDLRISERCMKYFNVGVTKIYTYSIEQVPIPENWDGKEDIKWQESMNY